MPSEALRTWWAGFTDLWLTRESYRDLADATRDAAEGVVALVVLLWPMIVGLAAVVYYDIPNTLETTVFYLLVPEAAYAALVVIPYLHGGKLDRGVNPVVGLILLILAVAITAFVIGWIVTGGF